MHRIMSETNPEPSTPAPATPSPTSGDAAGVPYTSLPGEVGGREAGLEPTRYGDWEKNGRCIDF
jgi:hypothetical protein